MLDGGQLRQLRCEQRDERGIDDDHAVFGMVGHVDQLFREQADVEGVQDGAHRRYREIRLEVFGVVPHERRDTLVAVHAEARRACASCAHR